MKKALFTALAITTVGLLLAVFMVTGASAAGRVTLQYDPNMPAPDFYRGFQRFEGDGYDYSSPLVIPGVTSQYGDIPGDVTTFTIEDVGVPDGEVRTVFWVVRAGLNYVTAAAATGGGNDFIENTNENWSVDRWENYEIRIVAGTGAGQRRTIDSNTATRIVVATAWQTAPDNTSIYDIFEESGDSNEVNQAFDFSPPGVVQNVQATFDRVASEINLGFDPGSGTVTQWKIFYTFTSGQDYVELDTIENTGQQSVIVTQPFTAVNEGERRDVYFVVVAFRDAVFSENSPEVIVDVDRRVATPPTLRINATIPVQ